MKSMIKWMLFLERERVENENKIIFIMMNHHELELKITNMLEIVGLREQGTIAIRDPFLIFRERKKQGLLPWPIINS